ncbi:hypothetical protein [Psychrobacter sp. W2-37-MNA-CIBAN-0211]|uniref:crAss001_48 related protein n=1 Tax=Psychrobacter sp. W2-37-MNA-CIBAN-0211 TaxID=3140443 RepID=UPI00332ADD3B
MKQYTGTKVVNATPMTREAYNHLRGWQVPSDENPLDEGYLVEYMDGGQSNTDSYDGYVSWSPKDVFEKSYLPSSHPLDRMAIENMQLIERLKPLDELLAKPQPKFISDKQWTLLHDQRKHMTAYFNTLDERIEGLAAELGA